jgi:hypothetical protein
MANKKIEIEVGVKTDQLDKAAAKLGELKQLSSKISVQYDINGKPIDVVIDKSLNLKRQVVELTKSLRSVKEGTAEFKLLSTALGDAQDKLAQSNAKSKDLLGSLQLIPGPIGQIASQLNGAISVLKTFSSFSLKDVQFQFKETFNDIKDIAKGFLGLNNVSNETKNVTNNLKDSTNGLSKSLGETAGQATAVSTAIKSSTASYSRFTTQQQTLIKGLDQIESKFENVNTRIVKGVPQIQTMTGAYRNLTQAELMAVKSGSALTLTTDGLIAAEKTATFWTSTLGTTIKTVLISTGVLAAVVALGYLVSALYKMASGEEDAEAATRQLTTALEEQQRVLENDQQAIESSTKLFIARAKLAGASEQEIIELTKKANDEKLKLLREYDEQLLGDQLALTRNTKINTEDREKLSKDINDKILKNGQAITKQILDNESFRLDSQLALNQNYFKNRLADIDARIKLEIDKDITSGEKLNKLLKEKLAIRLKFEKLSSAQIQVIKAENAKIEEDALNADTQRIEAFQSKVSQLQIDAIKDAQTRDESARTKKLNDDLLALTYDKEFIKASAEEKQEIRDNLEIKYQEDILKIRDTYFQKQFKQQQDRNLLENQLFTQAKEIELQYNQQRLDDGIEFEQTYGDRFVFGTKNLRKMLEERFIDLRQVYNDEYTANEEQFRQDEEALRINLENKKITKETYDTEIYNLDQKRIQNAQTNTQRQLQLDKLEVDSKRASADMTIQIGQNLSGLLGAIAGKNIKLQKAAAILDAGVSIARIVTDTSRAIIAFSASVAPLGPAGVPIAAGYAVKSKISAGLAIATIIAQGIGKLKSIDESSLSSEGGGGQGTSSTTRGMAKGGYIDGPRHAGGGVMINAEGGEAVMTRGAVSMFGPMLSMMNQAGGGVSFNSNLMTTRQDNPILSNPSQDQSPIVVKTYVVEKDMVSQMNKQARLKDLSTL